MCFILNIKISIKWHIPFTHSIETVGSDYVSFTNQVNENNLWNKVAWLSPDKPEGKHFFVQVQIYKVLFCIK